MWIDTLRSLQVYDAFAVISLFGIMVIGICLRIVWNNMRKVEQEQRRVTDEVRAVAAFVHDIKQEKSSLNDEVRSRVMTVDALVRTLRRESTLNRADIIKLEGRLGNVRSECRRARRRAEGGETE